MRREAAGDLARLRKTLIPPAGAASHAAEMTSHGQGPSKLGRI